MDIYICKKEMFCRLFNTQNITTNIVDGFINHQD